MAEKIFRAEIVFNDAILVTIGIGISYGIIICNNLYHGGMNTAKLCVLNKTLECFSEKFKDMEKIDGY